jgi:Skp family chaperone for outer membrane proteins
MKVIRVLATVAMLVAVAPLVQSQSRTTSRVVSRQLNKSARPANISVIDTTAFMDQKTGINRMMSAMRQLQAKYEPVRVELVGMRNRLEAMRFDIQRNKGIQQPQLIAQQTAEADHLDLQIKRKAEEAQTNYNRDRVAVIDPLQKDITNALSAYAQAKGITLLFDMNQVPVLFSAPHVNITRDFIAEYNRTHPVTSGR